MPPWWGKSSSKDVKKKSSKDNLIDTLHRFITPTEQKRNVRSGGSRKHGGDTASVKGSLSQAESQSTSSSTQVSRCQSFADRPHAHPLPLPRVHSSMTCRRSGHGGTKPMLEKRGKAQLLLPLPTPNHVPVRLDTADIYGDLTTASVSSNCSVDSDDSQLHSPVGNDFENGSGRIMHYPSSVAHRDHSPINNLKSSKETAKSASALCNNQSLSSSPKKGTLGIYQSNNQIPYHSAPGSVPDSSMSSPSRSPMRVFCPEQILTSVFWSAKPYPDVNFLGSGQCSSPCSGQTSGHNSMGGDMSGQLFWQHSRGSPECSPILSPRMTSPGPSSRIHSEAVSPLHPQAGGTTPESPTSRADEAKKPSHRLPLPRINISNSSPFLSMNSALNTLSLIHSPGRADNPPSPGPRWKKGKLIGHGTFGLVYVGFNSESGEMCAMKEVTLFSDDAKSKESAKQLAQEIALLSQLRHPNIVQYYGSEMINDKLYIYLEYVSAGSIHKLLQEYGQFGEVAIRSYTQQILSGLAYLHAKNTVHRDIKGANILVDPNGRVRLADFGMAKHITGQSCPFSFKGSPYWMAPEVIKNANGCNLAVDIWSLGCTILEMATTKPPWSQYEGIAALFKIGNSKELPAIPDHLSADGKDFVRQCLQREPSNRPTAAELLQHPFVKNPALLEKSVSVSDPFSLPTSVPCGTNFKGSGHQLRGVTPTVVSRDSRTRNMSCPISPIRSPMLNARSSRHINGRISSRLSSPIATSGSSTPITGCGDAIPVSQPKYLSSLHEGFTHAPRVLNSRHASASTYDPELDIFRGAQKGSLLWGK
ncbi:mitogen-activated protein kinase kinase kinase YODA-like [Phoenix dactylifera]|uniref:mitogen-activated protein kinase kinase kinase n=1 Tax=Phoenix dactylifera TaxID=42345 RepID=A0A8B7BXM3_PHODC|nr:mitogen-activated protein kinase kinase kinase YODA-like [Phoenix dactylifera]